MESQDKKNQHMWLFAESVPWHRARDICEVDYNGTLAAATSWKEDTVMYGKVLL